MLKPLNAGIIAALKSHYKRTLAQKIVDNIENIDVESLLKNINLIDAIKMILE